MSKIAVNLDSDSVASQFYLQENAGMYRFTVSALRGSCTVVISRDDLQAIYSKIRDTLSDVPVLDDRITFDTI